MLYKRSIGEKIFNIFNIIFLTIIALLVIYPFVNVIAISLNEGMDTIKHPGLIFPSKFTLENYRVALSYPLMKQAAFVSFSRTILATAIHLIVCTLAAYAFSKKDLPFRKMFLLVLLVPLFLNPGIIPGYLNMRNLKMLDTFWVYLFPGAFAFFDFLIIRTFVEGIPDSLEESAIIDGASYLQVFVKIIIPLSKPVLAAIGLFCAVGVWNDWFTTMLYTNSPKIYTLQYLLQKILQENLQQEMISYTSQGKDLANAKASGLVAVTSTSVRMATLMISTLPIMLIYPFIQKYFEQGMMIGAIKG